MNRLIAIRQYDPSIHNNENVWYGNFNYQYSNGNRVRNDPRNKKIILSREDIINKDYYINLIKINYE